MSKTSTSTSPSPSLLPLVALRDTVLYPGSLVPLLLGREASILAVERAKAQTDSHVLFVLQKDPDQEEIKLEALHQIGVVGRIQSSVALPGGMQKITVESLQQVEIIDVMLADKYFDGIFEPFEREKFNLDEAQKKRLLMIDILKEYLMIRNDLPKNLIETLSQVEDLYDFLMAAIPFLDMDLLIQQELLEEKNALLLGEKFEEILEETFRTFKLKQRLDQEVRMKLQNSQKEFMIKEQIRLLQDEIGVSIAMGNPEIEALVEKLAKLPCPQDVKEKLDEEIQRMAHIPPGSPEYATVRNYLDLAFDLPWGKLSKEQESIPVAKKILAKHHYGLEKVKTRILEHLAVLSRSGSKSAPILCLVGPPGVGKTSLAKSVAEATGRQLMRIALGGLRDEAEIRGHRKTYIGAMPGRLVDAMKKSQTMNPLILLDELDKLSSDYRGDPSSALLEVLDPEQNHAFTDHYLGFGIDLSQVLFLCTANVEQEIPGPLRDRMEILRLPGYHNSEKVAIARKHLYPESLADHTLVDGKDISISDEIFENLIRSYTREAGVRQLRRHIDQVMRRRVLELGMKQKHSLEVDEKLMVKYLGVAPFLRNRIDAESYPGMVNGLAWTSVGGEVLKVQCTLLQGRGRLKLTGTLGEVMKESAHIALTLVKQRGEKYGVNPDLFKETDIHIHFPEGATPKDGPSAGVALVLTLLSAYAKKEIPPYFAFTGEVSLSGEVLTIGGLPEKCLGALEAGVQQVFIPAGNKRQVRELPAEVRKGLKINAYANIDPLIREVFRHAK